ncbi:MAG: hypothetical protein ACOC6G_04370 [Thermoproteota archaeon]
MCIECGCHAPSHHVHRHHRRVLTDKEREERLKNYAEDLRKELAVVEERIKELKS